MGVHVDSDRHREGSSYAGIEIQNGASDRMFPNRVRDGLVLEGSSRKVPRRSSLCSLDTVS